MADILLMHAYALCVSLKLVLVCYNLFIFPIMVHSRYSSFICHEP